jgi:23S rRNA (cytidine1920-2'-O)/16S rRNA (cytidine1409-2'-O)-methyltransferase
MTREPMKIRLDQALVARNLVATRARARDLVLRGEVSVDGRTVTKPSTPVDDGNRLSVADGAGAYVSRGALKLRHALDHFGLGATGRIALDIGASTGGFTETLLAAGAARVYAVDNGRGQLHPDLAADPRVVSLEGMDARTLDASVIPVPAGVVVADVSFVSLTKVLPAALALTAPGAWLAVLIKPQFELEPGRVPRDGIVKDEAAREEAVTRVTAWVGALDGWQVLGCTPSPIHGGGGNVEFLLGARRHG